MVTDETNVVGERIANLSNALEHGNEKEIGHAVIVLLGGALLDLRIIATAVAKLSTFEVDKIGEILHVGPKFTAEEVETIEALRRGDIVVSLVPEQNLADEIERRAMQAYRTDAENDQTAEWVTWSNATDNTKEVYREKFRRHIK